MICEYIGHTAAIFVRFSIDTVSHVCLEAAKIPFITAPSPLAAHWVNT